jgi:FAD/FMN-containing dehydrogenase
MYETERSPRIASFGARAFTTPPLIVASGSRWPGSGAHRQSNPFYRHFGTDLTGIFTADPGAFGIKSKITLRLIDAPAVTLNASFGFATIEAMLDVQIQLARKRIASGVQWISIPFTTK